MPEALDRVFLEFQSAVAGRYSLERELGRGGMGIVYLAREVRLDRLVAIKLLPPTLAAQALLRERFLREARMAARLSQPNIIPIFAVDEAGDFVFYVMAYVDGETLAHRVAARGPLPPPEATRILREVAWALAYAHAQGVVHRDVKPENILIEQGTGRALVADFGIARLAQAGGGTGVGEVLGTPDFMSPEQASGEAVDGRTDLYSLGVVGYYMLSGKLPFDGPNAAAVMSKHLTVPAPPLAPSVRGAPASLCQAIDRCLAKDPAERPATGEALAEALGASLEAVRDTPVPVRVFLRKITRDQSSLIGGGLLMTLMFLPSLMMWLGRGAGSLGALAGAGAFAVVLGSASLTVHWFRVRALLRVGYGAEDVALATRLELDRRREELAFEYGPEPPHYWNRGVKLAMVIGVPSFALAFSGVGGIIPGLGIGVALLVGLLSIRRSMERRDFSAEMRGRFWRSGLARWLFRLAGYGLKRAPVAAANRPTELALGAAADGLFHELPKETRRALGDLPEVIRGLEARAQRMRGRIEEIDHALAAAGEGRGARASVAADRRDALVADLRTAREAAQARQGEVVAALETIRLDLLRLRAGAGSLESVTADLTNAREVGEQTERLLAAHGEIEKALRRV